MPEESFAPASLLTPGAGRSRLLARVIDGVDDPWSVRDGKLGELAPSRTACLDFMVPRRAGSAVSRRSSDLALSHE
jgi:hypothetical protein